MREGAGGERSRVREVADGRDGAERGDGAAGRRGYVCAGRAERPRRESSDLGEISAGSRRDLGGISAGSRRGRPVFRLENSHFGES